MDFRAVFVVNIAEDMEREGALINIAMTRALEWLFLTFNGNSFFTNYLLQEEKDETQTYIMGHLFDTLFRVYIFSTERIGLFPRHPDNNDVNRITYD
jgi:hypothetical protein